MNFSENLACCGVNILLPGSQFLFVSANSSQLPRMLLECCNTWWVCAFSFEEGSFAGTRRGLLQEPGVVFLI